MHSIKIQSLFFLLILLFNSCQHEENLKEEDKIFHAAPSTGGVVGSLYFALYKHQKYMICNSGGIGEECYTGDYMINGDTITLKDLSKEIPLSSNRLLIIRYNNQDSSYWKFKYDTKLWTWQELKYRDSIMGNSGDVYEIDKTNKIIKDRNNSHFVIALDSLSQ